MKHYDCLHYAAQMLGCLEISPQTGLSARSGFLDTTFRVHSTVKGSVSESIIAVTGAMATRFPRESLESSPTWKKARQPDCNIGEQSESEFLGFFR
jgi:hypothetical protein